MNKHTTRKIAISGILIAVGVIFSAVSFPVGASKCAPIQHFINIISAVFLGPYYGVCMAFITSIIRVASGLGTILAFPGSMCGAFLSGILYKYTKKLPFAYIGELFGTGIIGAILAYPIASGLMGKDAAIFTYVIPFLVSSLGGTIIAMILTGIIKKTHALDKFLGD